MEFINSGISYLNELSSGIIGKLSAALLILLVGFIIGRLVGRLLGRVLHEVELDNILNKTGFKMPVEHTLATFAAYLIYFIAVIMALNQLGLTTAALYIIVGGAIAMIIIATALGIKDFIPNMIAGIFIYRKGIIKENQRMIIKNIEGKVKKISLIETELETKSGDIILVPNSLIIRSTVIVKKKS